MLFSLYRSVILYSLTKMDLVPQNSVCESSNFCAECETFTEQPVSIKNIPEQVNEDLIVSKNYQPRGNLARTLYNKYLADKRLEHYDRKRWYACKTCTLPESVRQRFIQLSEDQETKDFLEEASYKSDSVFTQIWYSIAKAFLTWFMTQTSVNGLLGRGSMFVFSREQFRQLLAVDSEWRGAALLDLGAGDGRATHVMSPLFQDVYVTEISTTMRWSLSKRGFRVLNVDTWSEAGITFDVVTCLNLLDRCDRPLTLLRELRKVAASSHTRVVIALVLPYSPYVETGQIDHRPQELLPISGKTFEEQVNSAITDLFEVEGFIVERWSRVPYFCEGDLNQSYYWLDDAVFVLRANLTR